MWSLLDPEEKMADGDIWIMVTKWEDFAEFPHPHIRHPVPKECFGKRAGDARSFVTTVPVNADLKIGVYRPKR